MVFLGPITVSVISGLQAKTVRLTLMNVAVATVAMRTTLKVFVLTSMNPAPLVPVAKDSNVYVGMASQVFEKNLVSFAAVYWDVTQCCTQWGVTQCSFGWSIA